MAIVRELAWSLVLIPFVLVGLLVALLFGVILRVIRLAVPYGPRTLS